VFVIWQASTVHTELAASLLKIVRIIEALAQATGSEYTSLVSMPTDGVSRVLGADQHGDRGQIAGNMQWKDSELENAMRSLVLVGNKLLQGKSDMVYFISELGLTLERIMSLKPFEIPSQGTKCEYDSAVAEQHAAGGAAARMNLNALQSVSLLPNREIKAAARRSPLKDELPRTRPRFLGAGAPQDSKGLLKEDDLLEEELMVLSSVNPRQMLSLQVSSGEMNHLHEKMAALEGQLKDERQQRQEVIAKIEDTQHKIHL
jgi:hypothetical protein